MVLPGICLVSVDLTNSPSAGTEVMAFTGVRDGIRAVQALLRQNHFIAQAFKREAWKEYTFNL